ncbi:MAG TPA: four helix bundle protein [Chitinophaga sp.]|uniref:four helix bundle protein n=1 Tax=Chitinophaga sp. TaxID=1869181 RepID=UPI002DBB8530|nr:four helix bundle protein [Chitinophaga sp.]HEU4555978.1 four helix bundle protein [Chitinophaga sp.]
MKSNNVVQEKAFRFGVRIVKLYRYLYKGPNLLPLLNQILGCGTAIGANIEEAIGGVSKKEFIVKMQIAYKEARETRYRLRLLIEAGEIELKLGNSVVHDCEELLKIMTSILNTSRQHPSLQYQQNAFIINH